jgi:serine/threonine protein kinase
MSMPAEISPPENAEQADCEAVEQDALFGEVAVSLGLVTAEQAAQALAIQAQRRANGARARIGDVLLERGVLDLHGIQKTLFEQKLRRARNVSSSGHEHSFSGRAGPFDIIELVGRGGMGGVYKAIDTRNGVTVALKLLAKRWLNDAEFLARFEREIKTAAALSHPNIVRSLGSGSLRSASGKNGRPYLVMEFVDGENLGRLLRREQRLNELRALTISRDVAAALGYAHRQGIIHRDVKPDNVLIDKQGAKLTDFGLAKLLQETEALTRSGVAVGTPHYISPEQITSVRNIDCRADLYGLGAMLCHMLTGAPPFDAATRNEILLRHVDSPPPDPRERIPELSRTTAVIVLRLLAKQPADRYEDAEALGADLERACTELQPAAAPRSSHRASLLSRVAAYFRRN